MTTPIKRNEVEEKRQLLHNYTRAKELRMSHISHSTVGGRLRGKGSPSAVS